MGVLEYSYERHMQLIQNESYNNGYSNGHDGGIQDTNKLYSWLVDNSRDDDISKAIKDPEFLSQLFKEYAKWKTNNLSNS